MNFHKRNIKKSQEKPAKISLSDSYKSDVCEKPIWDDEDILYLNLYYLNKT